MGGAAEQINRPLGESDIGVPNGLNGIGVEVNPRLAAELTDGIDRLHRADFVLAPDHGHQSGRGCQQGGEALQADPADVIDGQGDHLPLH